MPYFSKRETREFVWSAIIVTTIASVLFVATRCEGGNRSDTDSELSEADIQEIKDFNRNVRRISADKDHSESREGQLFPFDPNHADSATLRRLGFRTWQISNMMKYREKGGVWHSAKDFSRLYGLSAEDYERLRPYVRIAAKDLRPTNQSYTRSGSSSKTENARPSFPATAKYSEGTVIDINTADTVMLMHIPGIGHYKARQIIAYRERLGGFVSIRQLNEIEDLPPNISRWFSLTPPALPRQIDINHATFKALLRHPYLSYEQTRTIVNHIRKYGKLTRLKELEIYEVFTPSDINRLKPYVILK